MVTSFDVLRIMKATGIKAEDFVFLHEPRLLTQDPDLTLDFSDSPKAGILGLKSHPCVFLKRNRCTIHDFAPFCCKKYPYHLGNKRDSRCCPIVSNIMFAFKKPELEDELIVEELKLYMKIVAEWNRKPGKKKDCLEFLLGRTNLRNIIPHPKKE
jgi:Fe-S-cluster containining protein